MFAIEYSISSWPSMGWNGYEASMKCGKSLWKKASSNSSDEASRDMNNADDSDESNTDLLAETGEADVASTAELAGVARPEVSRHNAMTLPRWRGFLLCLAAVYSQVRSRCSHWLHLRSRAPLQRTFLNLHALHATEALFVVDADGTGAGCGADTGRSLISARTVRTIAHSTMVG